MSADLDPPTTYLLPIRRPPGSGALEDELVGYLKDIGRRCDVIVVDGSAEAEFAVAHDVFAGLGVHTPPDDDIRCANGKVRGVLTGMRRVRTERVVIADDDVRYDDAALDRIQAWLDTHDAVVPQNYFAPRPWHAVWDTARTLLNRSVGMDFPGTIALRTQALEPSDGYDGDVLFENLELIRTLRATGATIAVPLDLYVRRLPPASGKFVEQRVRQAYDEFARPPRLALALATLPFVAVLARRPRRLAAATAVLVALAEAGRRRAGGRAVFPVAASLCAPAWVLERGVCSWIAVGQRLRGGCPYAGHRLRRSATSYRVLARRYALAVSKPSDVARLAGRASSDRIELLGRGQCQPHVTVPGQFGGYSTDACCSSSGGRVGGGRSWSAQPRRSLPVSLPDASGRRRSRLAAIRSPNARAH